MAIEGASLAEAARKFCDHFNSVLSRTITQARLQPIHLDTILDFRGREVSLKQLHVATGYVPFEEVIRFCIVELGAPPLKENWEEALKQSYESFKSEFTK